MQITADVLGLPAYKPSTEQTSGLGAAILAANELGWYRGLPAAVQGMTHKGEMFEPQITDVNLYDRLYRQVYQKMYPKLRPLFRAVQEITGYPSH